MEGINERIQEIINVLEVRKSHFAAVLNVSPSFITQVCAGRCSVSDRTISDICRIFHVSEHWLRTGEGEMFAARSLDQELAALAEALMQESSESFRKRFIAALLQLPQEFWPELEKFVEALRKGGTP